MPIIVSGSGRTVQQVIDSARITLNDTDAVPRFSNTNMIGFVVDAVNGAKQGRPDLFLGSYGADYETFVLTDILPISSQYFRPIVDYVIARCEMTDDEYASGGRAELMAKLAVGFMS